MYSTFAYFLSRNIVELPLLIINPIIGSLICYWMVELHSGAEYFFLNYFVSFLANLCGNAYGFLLGSFFNDTKVASMSLPMIMMPLMVFSGFFKIR